VVRGKYFNHGRVAVLEEEKTKNPIIADIEGGEGENR